MSRPEFVLSHVGLFVHDLPLMEDFYTRVLEFTVTDRGQLASAVDGRVADLLFMSRDPNEHHQIVLVSGRPQNIDFNIVNQLSLRADGLGTLRIMHRRLTQERVTNLVTVTHGNAISIYGLDPEGTRLEFYMHTPWYVTQPTRVPLDFSMDDVSVMRFVEAHARQLPGFKSREQWRSEMMQRMGVTAG